MLTQLGTVLGTRMIILSRQHSTVGENRKEHQPLNAAIEVEPASWLHTLWPLFSEDPV